MNRIFLSPKFSGDTIRSCLEFGSVFLLLFLILTGCSAGKSVFPSDPNQPDFANSVPVIAPEKYSDGFSATGLLGAYELTIDEKGISGELVPMRTPSLGQSYIVNGASFFTITPCATCLKLKALAYDYPYIRADFLISHPFEKGDPSKPPSATNRLDLDIFDPILIVVPEDAPTEPHLLDVKIYSESCGYADGYTRELTDVIDNEFACPYFLAVDDSDTKISTWNRFEMGTKDHRFSAWFTGGRFELFLTFGYGVSTRTYLDRLDPVYYNPEFNRKAPWKVNVIPPANGWPFDDNTTTRDLVIEIYDWQIDAIVDPNLNLWYQIYAASDIVGVGIEIEGMFDELKISTTPEGDHTGRPDDPLIFRIPIANENLLQGPYYQGYVKVLDRRVPPQSPIYGQIDSMVDVPDGVTLNFVSMPEFSTYQTFTAEVWSNDPPIADLDVSDYFIESGHSIELCPGPATDDPDGSIIKYEYDFDYYGTEWFDVEASNTDGSPVTSPLFYNTTSDEITRKVAMRVTDNGDPQKSAVGVETITIYPETYNRWVRTWGGISSDEGTDIDIDNMGNIYVCGFFNDIVDFNPEGGGDIHSAIGDSNMFVTKYNTLGQYQWTITVATDTERHVSIAYDDAGKIYIAGIASGVDIDFDPGPCEVLKTCINNGFVAQYDNQGNFYWVQTWGGFTGNDWLTNSSIAVDNENNILVGGSFTGTADLDPTDGELIKQSGRGADSFISKFSSTGDFIWNISYGGTGGWYDSGSVVVYSISNDIMDSIFVTGEFNCEVDFDPDPVDTDWHHIGDPAQDRACLTKFDSNGDYKWTLAWGSNINNAGHDLTINTENIYVCGEVDGYVADLDPGPGEDLKTGSVGWDIFLSKFDLNGNYKWGHRIGGILYDYADSIAVSPNGNVYLIGTFQDIVDFDPGPASDLIDARENGNATFITKFRPDGSYLGTRALKCTDFSSGVEGLGIVADESEFAFITGSFGHTVDFDPSSYGTDYRTSNNRSLDLFLLGL